MDLHVGVTQLRQAFHENYSALFQLALYKIRSNNRNGSQSFKLNCYPNSNSLSTISNQCMTKRRLRAPRLPKSHAFVYSVLRSIFSILQTSDNAVPTSCHRAGLSVRSAKLSISLRDRVFELSQNSGIVYVSRMRLRVSETSQRNENVIAVSSNRRFGRYQSPFSIHKMDVL